MITIIQVGDVHVIMKNHFNIFKILYMKKNSYIIFIFVSIIISCFRANSQTIDCKKVESQIKVYYSHYLAINSYKSTCNIISELDKYNKLIDPENDLDLIYKTRLGEIYDTSKLIVESLNGSTKLPFVPFFVHKSGDTTDKYSVVLYYIKENDKILPYRGLTDYDHISSVKLYNQYKNGSVKDIENYIRIIRYPLTSDVKFINVTPVAYLFDITYKDGSKNTIRVNKQSGEIF